MTLEQLETGIRLLERVQNQTAEAQTAAHTAMLRAKDAEIQAREASEDVGKALDMLSGAWKALAAQEGK